MQCWSDERLQTHSWPNMAEDTSARETLRLHRLHHRTVPAASMPRSRSNPNRPTPQVSNIAQSILSELDRVRGATMKLTLDIDAEAVDGFPEDVESVIRDNAASLRITDFGFEGD